MKIQLFVLGLLCSTGLAAQNTSSVSGQSVFGLELRAGTNLTLNHRPVFERIDFDNRTLQPGWRAGLTGVLGGELSRSSLVFSLDFINDRITLNGYRQQRFAVADTDVVPDLANRREGKFTVNENQIRGLLAHRIELAAFRVEYGFSISGFVGGRQRYDFTQTTVSWSDPVSGLPIVFEEPLISTGSVKVPNAELGRAAYGAFVFGGGYRITDQLSLSLEMEFGLTFRDRTKIDNRYKQKRSRLGLVVAYRFFNDAK